MTEPEQDRPEQHRAPGPSRRSRFKRFRRALFGEPAAVAFYGPADLGPGRYASKEQWAEYYDELRNPPPRRPSDPPPGYKFIWYTDTTGQRHRAAVRDTGDTGDADPAGPADPADPGAIGS